jgi:hypothetical protein
MLPPATGIARVTRQLTRSDVGCKTVANMIKGKTPEEIRKLFNITNEYVGPRRGVATEHR